MKRKRKTKVPKERNEFIAAVRFRHSGAHGKTKKAERRAEKVALQKQMDP